MCLGHRGDFGMPGSRIRLRYVYTTALCSLAAMHDPFAERGVRMFQASFVLLMIFLDSLLRVSTTAT